MGRDRNGEVLEEEVEESAFSSLAFIRNSSDLLSVLYDITIIKIIFTTERQGRGLRCWFIPGFFTLSPLAAVLFLKRMMIIFFTYKCLLLVSHFERIVPEGEL